MTEVTSRTGERPGSPFEADILDQPRALRAFLEAPRPARPAARPADDYDRIIVTGMGASHFAGLRTWRRLTAAGLPAWWIPTDELLESLDLVSADALLVVTSQSGASGEIGALLDVLGTRGEVIGVTNDPQSQLGGAAGTLVELCCGTEATVSTKSYVNSLAAHEWLTAMLLGTDAGALAVALEDALNATATGGLADEPDLAQAVIDAEPPRLALIGAHDHFATALLGGLILKEATKLPAEGFTGGSFRHGPLELAGPGLTALFFGLFGEDSGAPLLRLADDVEATGATVVRVGRDDARPLDRSVTDGLAGLVHGAIVCQWFSVALARARGITPGEFRYGAKVTAL